MSSGADGVWFRGVSCRTDICHRFVVRVSLYVCGMGGKYPPVCENDSLTDSAVITILKEMICLRGTDGSPTHEPDSDNSGVGRYI